MRAAARARASRALRACEAEAEYAGLVAAFGCAALGGAGVERFETELLGAVFLRAVFWAASTDAGRHTLRPSSRVQRRITNRGRIRRTGPP